ncbi:NFX1-type zinc finger-containing protein 1-like [Anticarsia gemmatalis]|uniref:NFX1-type zinc finger-containing protein 1-like n=1 Tax=Anticarsia gemmatalis TaxID=129554 RepID=UPI003F75DF93
MSESNKASLRIDWFDGTLIEDARANTSTSEFADEDQPEPKKPDKPQYTEKKPIGFKRLLDISLLKPPILNLEVSHRPGFWNLLDEKELKGDFIVLIVKILASIYKCLEPGENSKIVKMLRSRFQNSNFLENLKSYLDELPIVRIVEKRLNSHLWDDAESFFNNVTDLCEGIINFEGANEEFMKELLDLLEVTEVSAIGVKEEHTERFSDELFERIEALKLEAMSLLKDKAAIDAPLETQNLDKDYFKNLNIFPTQDDLLSPNKVPIQPNIINGAYPSVEHYLDVQFKLLREDCFGPLREGICKYLENPAKRRHENIRIYPKVRILRNFVSNNKVGHLVDIAYKDRINHGLIDTKKYSYNKQLMFGSLLLFTCDNFENILCSTVLDSNYNLLSEGYVAVSFQNPTSKSIFSESYLMVESEVFFEPYHRVLKVLQEARLDDLPMKRYIVDVQTETRPPEYLTDETIYTLPHKDEEIPFPVLDTDQWPDTFGLDASQMEAFKFALTREFAVIQGPPGTGKTYIGVKIATTILKNLSLEGTPMLVICYTNHALDQFLEGILNVTNSIVRLGSQSKNAALEKYTLNNLRMKVKSKYSYLYGKKRGELETIFKQMTEVQGEIEKCEKEIISYKSLKSHLKVGEENFELKSSKEDSVLSWLFGHLEESSYNEEETEVLEDWEKLDETAIGDEIETCFSEKWALKEIDSLLNSMKYVADVTDDQIKLEKMTEKLEGQIKRVRRRLNCFKKFKSIQNDNKQEYEVKQVKDVYSLKPEQRWWLYYKAVDDMKKELMNKMNDLLEQHNTTNQELNEVATSIDGDVMSTVRVVGVTTTTAARRHDLMRKLLSPIVIVEEAAEVLEAHIVSSLTHHCKHLILIGDHKQLRPTAAHYQLAKHYNLEISLFERMIRNGVHARTLTTQRRMRPEVVQLIVPTIYDKLDSYSSVYSYPDVRGMRNNLYFCTHDSFEDSEGMEDSWSHRNSVEAKWCVALANYLRQMKYNTDEITILSTYTGQVSLIKELSKKYSLLRDVKITAVDNYQGEENRIVILSLVRSNRDNRIGFLTAPNRICVALSRAKEGFYLFGNMNVLKTASNIWKQINEKLVEQNAIGKVITLQCDTHKESTFDIEKPEDFENCRSGSCLKSCKIK